MRIRAVQTEVVAPTERDLIGLLDRYLSVVTERSVVAVTSTLVERAPLAVIEEVPFVGFQSGDPSSAELAALRVSIEDDLYARQLIGVRWCTGEA